MKIDRIALVKVLAEILMAFCCAFLGAAFGTAWTVATANIGVSLALPFSRPLHNWLLSGFFFAAGIVLVYVLLVGVLDDVIRVIAKRLREKKA